MRQRRIGQEQQQDRGRRPIVQGRLQWAVLVTIMLLVVGIAGGFALWQRAREQTLRSELAAAEGEMNAGLTETARSRLLALSGHYPDNAEVLFHLGICEQSRGRFDDAFKAWSKIPDESPFFARAATLQGTLGINTGRYSVAEAALLKAIPRLQDPVDTQQALRALSRLYRFEGRVADVRRTLRTLWPGSDDKVGTLKELWFLDYSPQPAEAWLFALQNADPNDDRVWLGRASLATLTADWKEANRWLEACEKAKPNDPAVARVRLELAMATDDPEAVRRAARVIPADQFSPSEILEIRAWLIALTGDKKLERQALEKVIAADSGNFTARERLSNLNLAEGNPDAMESLHKKRVELDQAKDRFRKLLLGESNLESHAAEMAELSIKLGRQFDAWAWQALGSKSPPGKPPTTGDAAPPGTVLSARLEGISEQRAITAEGSRSPLASDRGAVPTFIDDAEPAGLAFVFENGETPLHQLPETMSGGVAVLDYDNDGFLDVYLPQGGVIQVDSAALPNADRLYRNLGNGTFKDVSREAGIAGFKRDYGLGVTAADYNNDGKTDLFITRLTSYALYQNQGDGTFRDVTKEAGLEGQRDNPTSAAFADLDNDGDLDLYVAHYMKWDPADPRLCSNEKGGYFYCDPSRVDSAPDHVFRNDAGHFVEVTEEAGFTDVDGRGLGVVASDLDGDNKVDLYVANDGTGNFLFRNLGGFKFEDIGLLSGSAAGPEGGFQASMGVACGDQDGDGLPDLIVTNFYGESSTLYQNLGNGLFRDRTADSGLGSATRYLLGFGTYFGDFNNDGFLDLATVNGHVNDNRPFYPYQMPAQLLLGGRNARFVDAGSPAGEVWKVPRVGRGLAVADLDNDGKQDLLFASQNSAVAYVHNTSTDPAIGHFVTFKLEGKASNRDAIGAKVVLEALETRQVKQQIGGGSYQSTCDRRMHFGIGKADEVQSIEVTWPSGKVDRWSKLKAGTGYLLREGSAEAPELPEFRAK